MKRSEYKLRKFLRRNNFNVTIIGHTKNEGYIYSLERDNIIYTASTLTIKHLFAITGGGKYAL